MSESAGGEGRPLVIVTGAAKRVGRAVAIELAGRGCDLLLTYRTSRDAIERTSGDAIAHALARGHHIWVRTFEADLSDAAGLEGIGRELVDLVGERLAGIVHNASSYAPHPFGRITAEQALGHFTVNALAPLLLTQALASSLRAGRGSVLIFGDIHALGRPRRSYGAYLMSKAAVTDLVGSLAIELAPDVRVNGIAPGVVAWPESADEAEVRAYEARIPLRRAGSPEEAASLAAWLLLDASYITGEIVRIDGGRWLA